MKRHPAGRHPAHDPVVDGGPAVNGLWGIEVKSVHGWILASSRYTGFQTPTFEGNLMFNISDFLSNPETTQHLLERCYDFRGSVLLTPDEMALPRGNATWPYLRVGHSNRAERRAGRHLP